MFVGSVRRGVRNVWRSRPRSAVVIVLLALVTGCLALLGQAMLLSREQIATMEGRVRTLIELREAGAFGTGGFGGDKPLGEEHFSLDTLEAVLAIPSARHLAKVEEYVYRPEIDPSKKNAYAMVIGLHPEAALRAIGEVDYEAARIVAGRSLRPGDEQARVAVVGRLYAAQRLGLPEPSVAGLAGRSLALGGQPFEVIGVYSTGNDFGDNHVFVPLDAFRAIFNPGRKLSKIFVTVDSVANVERVVAELRGLPEADVVTTPEAVSTARTTLGSLAVASTVAALLLATIGAVLIVFATALSLRERVREIGTLKAIGASGAEVGTQLIAEAVAVSGLAGAASVLVALCLAPLIGQLLSLPLAFDARVAAAILVGSASFAVLGSLYPVARGLRLSPVEAMRRE